MDIYQNDFDEIVDLVWNVYQRNPVYPKKSHLRHICNELLKCQSKNWTTYTVDREDISQELAMLWTKYRDKYLKKKPGKPLLDYLQQCSIYGMKTWFSRHIAAVSHDNKSQPLTPEYVIPEFTLDLAFIAYGTPYWPLCELSPYERYLIFLKFKEEKPIIEISYVVQKHQEVVSNQLKGILNKLRSIINETQDTR